MTRSGPRTGGRSGWPVSLGLAALVLFALLAVSIIVAWRLFSQEGFPRLTKCNSQSWPCPLQLDFSNCILSISKGGTVQTPWKLPRNQIACSDVADTSVHSDFSYEMAPDCNLPTNSNSCTEPVSETNLESGTLRVCGKHSPILVGSSVLRR